jgi:hypothetical protein
LPHIDDKPPVGVLQTSAPVRAVEIKIEATERAHDYWGRAPNVCNGSINVRFAMSALSPLTPWERT